jgi:signal peptide peptidase SppA
LPSNRRAATVPGMFNWITNRFLRTPIVPVVRLSGVIAAGSRFGARGLSLDAVSSLLNKAFGTKGAKAVALSINSPGGSPVQSALIATRIRLLAAEKNIPVIAFVEDVAASGGYWLACAADEIVADPASIVGSIGVVSASFGFQDLIARFGVERRVHTSGERKAMTDVARLKSLQAEIHGDFKAWVRKRRGLRLKGEEAALFSGEFWTGRRALELGLIDSLGDLRSILQARYGRKVRLPVVAPRRSFLARFGLGARLDELGPSTLAAIEERQLWQRFGL